jgi:hypothetical protein
MSHVPYRDATGNNHVEIRLHSIFEFALHTSTIHTIRLLYEKASVHAQ